MADSDRSYHFEAPSRSTGIWNGWDIPSCLLVGLVDWVHHSAPEYLHVLALCFMGGDELDGIHFNVVSMLIIVTNKPVVRSTLTAPSSGD